MKAPFLFRIKNQLTGTLFPKEVARKAADRFLTPRRFPSPKGEEAAEKKCKRISRFGDGLSAARWGSSERKVLLMHGWESRATQLYNFVPGLVAQGFEVIGIDAPGHGRSKPGRANPVVFSKAICSANEKLGPFYGAIGHSMGAAAVSLAMESGVRFHKVVLISSPSNMYNVLVSFATGIGLPKKATSLFIAAIEEEVGRPVVELDVKRVFEALKPRALVIHSRNDKEIPFENYNLILNACPGLESLTPGFLGHRRIVRDKGIASAVSKFMGHAGKP